MADYYLTPDGNDANDGLSWGGAWPLSETRLQDAVNAVQNDADSYVNIAVDPDSAPGITLSAPIQLPYGSDVRRTLRGYRWDSSLGQGVEDGTRARLDADNTAKTCLYYQGWHWHFRNLEFRNATDCGVLPGTGAHGYANHWFNCRFCYNGAEGYYNRDTSTGYKGYYNALAYCRGDHNGASGLRSYGQATAMCSVADHNAANGFAWFAGVACCLAYANQYGFYGTGAGDFAVRAFCVADGNVYGFIGFNMLLLGCRATNNDQHGFVSSGTGTYVSTAIGCYAANNGGDDYSGDFIRSVNGMDTSGSGGGDGYRDRDNGLFETLVRAAGYGGQFVMPDGATIVRLLPGLPNLPTTGRLFQGVFA